MWSRRDILKGIGALGAGSALLQACGAAGPTGGTEAWRSSFAEPPTTRPETWDPFQYNFLRGDAGFIPPGYLRQTRGPLSFKVIAGEHLPYRIETPAAKMADGVLGVMFGDPEKGHIRHPSSPRDSDDPVGHWVDWVKIMKVGGAQVETRFDNWPVCSEMVQGRFVPMVGDDPSADGGRNSVMLVRLPEETRQGDELRIWCHCRGHGEYVDFMKVG